MLISRKRCSLPDSGYINGKVLEQVNSFKYLGVNISNNLTWSNHIDIVCSKARRMLHWYYNTDTFTLIVTLPPFNLYIYISLVRPRLRRICLPCVRGLLILLVQLPELRVYRNLVYKDCVRWVECRIQ